MVNFPHLIALIIAISALTRARGVELMGGHYNYDNQRKNSESNNKLNQTNPENPESTTDELIPDPSALIIPGYNLPGHLFNEGKPFYVEKDPLTGAINFNNKTPAGNEYASNEYDYMYDETSDIYNKANIDRKDGGYGSHRPNDVNQLTPNFHDFLPVKYNNPEKYTYPLISSSYANTKIQGNVNNYNHKQYSVTTYKPTVSPMYYTTKSAYYKPSTGENIEKTATTPSTSTENTFKATTSPSKSSDNLMNSPMNHPSYLTTVENEYDYDYFTTTESVKNQFHYSTKPPMSSTKRPYSIFDELFGDYEEPEIEEKPNNPPSMFSNSEDNYGNKIVEFASNSAVEPSTSSSTTSTSTTTSTTTTTTTSKPVVTHFTTRRPEVSSHYSKPEPVSEVFPEDDNNMYEYVEDYNNNYNDEYTPITTSSKPEISTQKSVVVSIRNETKPKNTTEKENANFHQNFNSQTEKTIVETKENTTRYSDRFDTLPAITTEKIDSNYISITTEKYNYFNDEDRIPYKSTKSPEKFTQTQSFTAKVTSMPLGENHPSNIRLPSVFTLNQNLKETLNREKIDSTTKSYQKPIQFEKNDRYENKPAVLHSIPSTSNIHIAPDQDMVSFVVGNQQNVDGGHYIGSAIKDEPIFSSNSFKPLYNQQHTVTNKVNFVSKPTLNKNNNRTVDFIDVGTSTKINVQSVTNSQASVSIGKPIDGGKTIPGQVVDEKLDINDDVEFPKETGSKIVFPQEDLTTFMPPNPVPNREILSLYSRPMFHQLPAHLTPPSEPEVKPLRNSGSVRPPWDPRPGHFYQGRPEYARPPRPHKPELFKRIDGLPNILPQFRPNARVSNNHYADTLGTLNAGYIPRQPLLDRPSNRPIGFFEKLHPPPPPKRLHDLRKVTTMEPEMKPDRYRIEERILNVPNVKQQQDYYGNYQMPPKVANRKSEDESEIATLQMIQAKQSEKLETIKPNVPPPFKINYQETTEKPLYVVYPVNTAPLKLDVLDNDKRETVVVGTRGEQLPLPPSKINQESQQPEQKPLLKPKDRNDSPILKPHSRPNTFPVKSDFPYILEKPDPNLVNIPVSSTNGDLVSSSPNTLDTSLSTSNSNKNDVMKYQGNNQWTSLGTESRIVNTNKINYVNDQISVTLKTYTEKEKPIAIAYTPTEPSNFYNQNDKYNIPNFSRPVMSEVHSESNKYGTVTNDDSEFTVSAVMHTHPQLKQKQQNEIKYYNPDQQNKQTLPLTNSRIQENLENHKLNLDVDTTHVPAKLDFQAPFHASVNIDSQYQGWSVVNSKNKIDRSDVEVTSSIPTEMSSEFDIENFKPQLYGGFKPIYSFPDKEIEEDLIENQGQE